MLAASEVLPIQICLILIVLPVGIFLAFYVRKHANETQKARLRAVAAQFPGSIVESGGWWEGPRLRCSGPGWQGVVSFYQGSKNSPAYSRLDLQFLRPRPVVRITPAGVFSGLAKFFGAEDVEIGVPEFDRAYMIAARPRECARELLAPETRGLIRRVHEYSRWGTLVVSTAGYRGELRIGVYLKSEDQIRGFLECAVLLAARLAGDDEGVRILEVAEMAEGLCQVCGQPLGSGPVRCRKCRTPHHRECWSYMGACSTFACGEKKFE